jgi:hypothetical protein
MKLNTPEWKEYAQKAMLIPMSKHVEMAEKNLRGIKIEKEKQKCR